MTITTLMSYNSLNSSDINFINSIKIIKYMYIVDYLSRLSCSVNLANQITYRYTYLASYLNILCVCFQT